MAHCVTGKKMYATQQLAEDALVEAWTRYRYSKGNGPVAVYRCEDCKQFHFTSKGEMNKTLAQRLADGRIDLQGEANHWLNKLKNR